MINISSPDFDWQHLLSWLPANLDLDASAEVFGALRRRRQLKSGGDLLRLALGYGPCGLSLRGAAAWAGLNGVGSLSDVAVLKRLRGAGDWLEHIVDVLLSDVALPEFPRGRRLRLVDGTCVCQPGSKGTDWRIHACYDPDAGRFNHLEITDAHGAESLLRGPVAPGDIHVADRGYAQAKGLHRIKADGGDFLVRTGWSKLKICQADGSALDLFGVLPEAELGNPLDRQVLIRDGDGTCTVSARLIAVRKPEHAAEQEKKRLRRNASKKGRKLRQSSLEAAGYVLLVTSLPQEEFDTDTIVTLYRLRWQIEIAFKRLKSIIKIGRLPAKDPDLARTWLATHLIAALLIERMNQDFLETPPSGVRTEGAGTFELANP